MKIFYNKPVRIPSIVLIVMLFAGCAPSGDDRITGGSGAGNPTGTASFGIRFNDGAAKTSSDHLAKKARASASALSRQLPDAAGTVFRFSRARLHVSSISFTMPEAGAGDYTVSPPVTVEDGRVAIGGSYTYDLFSGSSDPLLPLLSLPAGTYDQVRFKMWPAGSDMDSLPAGYTLELSGSFGWDGDPGRPFTIRLAFNQTAVFHGSVPVSVTEGDTAGISLALDPSAWLAGVDISSCLQSGRISLQPDGSLLIDAENSTACNEIQVAVKNAILASGKLEEIR